ncbi:MAG: hypothetical protein KDK33_07970 [Leptospiraceae bacterium]|nr:hypothetical protein [Leptospiraceae bacterium]
MLFAATCTGFDGPDVIGEQDFREMKSEVGHLHSARCSSKNRPDAPSPNPDTQVALLINNYQKEDTPIFSSDIRFYYKKDVETCLNSLITSSCAASPNEVSFAVNYAIYCSNIEPVSLWENQHLGQGGWSPP